MTTHTRKAVITACLLAGLGTTGTVMATDRHDGIYLGVQGGWTNTDTRFEANDDVLDGVNISGPVGGLFLGTGSSMGSAFLGLEAHVNISGAEYEEHIGGDRTTLSEDHNWGLTARLGRVIGEATVLYALAGYQNTRFEAETVSGGSVESDDENVHGARIGGGVEFVNDNRNFARFEYSIVRHEDVDVDDMGAEFEPVSHQFLIGLGYRF